MDTDHPDPRHRPPDPARGLLRGRRDRARDGAPEPRSTSSSRRATAAPAASAACIAEPGRFLAVSQIGLTFIGFFASAFAAVSLTDELATVLGGHRHADPGDRASAIALVVVTLVLALFTIVFGELVPKTPRARPHRALTRSRLSGLIDFLLARPGPLVAALTAVTNAVVASPRRGRRHDRGVR